MEETQKQLSPEIQLNFYQNAPLTPSFPPLEGIPSGGGVFASCKFNKNLTFSCTSFLNSYRIIITGFFSANPLDLPPGRRGMISVGKADS